jgi:hypothetical protein
MSTQQPVSSLHGMSVVTPSRYSHASLIFKWCSESSGLSRPTKSNNLCCGKNFLRKYCGHSRYSSILVINWLLSSLVVELWEMINIQSLREIQCGFVGVLMISDGVFIVNNDLVALVQACRPCNLATHICFELFWLDFRKYARRHGYAQRVVTAFLLRRLLGLVCRCHRRLAQCFFLSFQSLFKSHLFYFSFFKERKT